MSVSFDYFEPSDTLFAGVKTNSNGPIEVGIYTVNKETGHFTLLHDLSDLTPLREWVVIAVSAQVDDCLVNPIQPRPCDINLDAAVDFNDLNAFVATLLGAPFDPAHPIRADQDGNGQSDGADIVDFVSCFIEFGS